MAAMPSPSDAVAIFRRFDRNGDGKIQVDNMRQVLKRLGCEFLDSQIDEMFQAADLDRDGFLDYREFVEWLSGGGLVPQKLVEEQETLPAPRLWTKRQRLEFSGLVPGSLYHIPLLLHDDDASDAFLTDEDGRILPCCEDSLYEAVDQTLFWLACVTPPSNNNEERVAAAVYLHRALRADAHKASESMVQEPAGCLMQFRRPEEALLFAEFFHGSKSSLLKRWELQGVPRQLQLEVFQGQEEGSIGAPLCGPRGNSLWLDSEPGLAAISHTVRSPGLRPERIHLRAHFYDDCEAGSRHSLACACSLGAGAAGLSSSRGEGHYTFVANALSPDQTLTAAITCSLRMQASNVARSRGWHLLELIFSCARLCIKIDGLELCDERSEPLPDHVEQVLLLSADGGTCAVWAGIECFHTPPGQAAVISQETTAPGERPPWRIASDEEGLWQFDGTYVMEHRELVMGGFVRLVDDWQDLVDAFDAKGLKGYSAQPEMTPMLGGVFMVSELLPNGMTGLRDAIGRTWYFPPRLLSMAAAPAPADPGPPPDAGEAGGPADPDPSAPAAGAPEADPPELPPSAAPGPAPAPAPVHAPGAGEEEGPREGALRIECWTRPGETDVARMERVMRDFLERLTAEGVALPGNIRQIERCQERQHRGCFVYRFGTRRLHFSTRAAEGGRLLLVVRCGGGFVDFVDFARRHGSLEQLRLQRSEAASGVVHVTSVLAQGRLQVRGSPGKGGASR